MSNRIFNCTTCNDNSPITFVADDSLIPLYEGIQSNYIIGLNSVGSMDESFVYGAGFIDVVDTITIQSDGKILVGGEITSYDGMSSNKIIRLNSDGSVDNTFSVGNGFNDTVRTIIIQSDGKILVGGSFTTYDGTPSNRIIRLNSDGSVDNTFVNGTGFNSPVYTISIQSDGKILVGGLFTSYDGVPVDTIIRLNSNGSIDNTFVVGNGFNSNVFTIQIQSDGKILVGGDFTIYSGTSSNNIIRLNSNGSIDNTFVVGNGFNGGGVRTIQIQSDGKILVGGSFGTYSGTSSNNIIRLNSNGSIDNTFVIGTGFNGVVYTIEIQSDGKILVGGDFIGYDGTISYYIIRLNSDGSIDNTFVIKTGFNNSVRTIVSQSNGKILMGGYFTKYKTTYISRIIRLNTSGLYDSSLSYNFGFDNTVYTISIQIDNKILVGGGFTSYDGTPSNYIIRLNSDGSVDNTFVYGSGFNNSPLSIQIQSDNKILVGGGFDDYNGTGAKGIIRLNSDGSIDGTFVYGSGFNGPVYTILIQSDGKILVGGAFTDYNGTGTNRIIRLNTDGSIDGSFVYGSGFDDTVLTISIQSDNKILVGGNFTDYNGTGAKRVIRLNTDGSIDGTFVSGDGFNDAVQIITIQPDGKILVGGDFTDYDGTAANKIIRLNSDGSVDNRFVYGTGFNGTVYTISIQSDNKILIGGGFSDYDGTGANRIIRLNSDGSIDNTFVIGSGFDDSVYTIQIQSDGKILAGGSFSSYPLNSGVFQLVEGNCVSIDSYGLVSRSPAERFFSFGPFISCIECSTPDDGAGVEYIICISCDDPESVTPTSVPHGIYLNELGRAIYQINTVGMGGFNGLNN